MSLRFLIKVNCKNIFFIILLFLDRILLYLLLGVATLETKEESEPKDALSIVGYFFFVCKATHAAFGISVKIISAYLVPFIEYKGCNFSKY